MIKQLDELPERYRAAYPYKDRPRQEGVFGVTEILYCLRKSFLTRVVPAPTAVEFEVRRRFARGHASEASFFGEKHNPMHLVGVGSLAKLEGHSDHVVLDSSGKPEEIVEYKSVLRLWHKAPNGKSYYSKAAARKVIPQEDWDKVSRTYNDNHMDQLMTYMFLTEAKKGYLIYTEMSTDQNYVWEIDYGDITDEFKHKIEGRLDILDGAMKTFAAPGRSSMYQWECGLCTHGKHGVCDFCDSPGFDLKTMCDILRKDPMKYKSIVGAELKKYNIASQIDSVPEEVNGEA